VKTLRPSLAEYHLYSLVLYTLRLRLPTPCTKGESSVACVLRHVLRNSFWVLGGSIMLQKIFECVSICGVGMVLHVILNADICNTWLVESPGEHHEARTIIWSTGWQALTPPEKKSVNISHGCVRHIP
jgi:hypothetical protein